MAPLIYKIITEYDRKYDILTCIDLKEQETAMSTAAVISEYNPFHNGHLYHLRESMRKTGADSFIAVMSGNFVQRGEPAVFNKLDRSEAAVRNGADAVFELPVRFSTAGAQDFAYAGVEIIDSLGIADYLSFGAETDDISVLERISAVLTNETVSFKSALKDHMKEGLSYPKARALALADEIGPEYADIMSLPNNILAIEYLSALKKLDSDIKPVIIKRTGTGHDSSYVNGSYASGRYIREKLIEGDKTVSSLVPQIPGAYGNTAVNNINPLSSPVTDDIRTITADDLQGVINMEFIKMQSSGRSDSTKYIDLSDITPELISKILSLNIPMSYNDIIESLKTKEITRAKICRALIHLVLGIKDIKELKYCPYTTLLALNKNSSGLIRRAADNNRISIINKRSDYKPDSSYAATLYGYDKAATDLYNLLYFERYGITLPGELSSNIRII